MWSLGNIVFMSSLSTIPICMCLCLLFYLYRIFLIMLFRLFLLKFLPLVQCDLLDMPAVGQLEKDAKYALVYQLLIIFLTQRLDAYLEFHAGNSTLLKSLGKFFCFIYLLGLLDDLGLKLFGFLIFAWKYAFWNVVGLVHEDCITKMRLMSLMDLGSDETGQIPYGLIKDTLRVSLLNLSTSAGVASTSWLT